MPPPQTPIDQGEEEHEPDDRARPVHVLRRHGQLRGEAQPEADEEPVHRRRAVDPHAPPPQRPGARDYLLAAYALQEDEDAGERVGDVEREDCKREDVVEGGC